MRLVSRLLILPLTCPSSTAVTVIALFFAMMMSPASLTNPETTLNCHIRRYKLHITKPPVIDKDGIVYRCSGFTMVNSCWGRCDSSEIGDYTMPYRISHHPVCTYTGRARRVVTLPDCPGYPDPTEVVFDATGCDCRLCNSDYTSCESLNG